MANGDTLVFNPKDTKEFASAWEKQWEAEYKTILGNTNPKNHDFLKGKTGPKSETKLPPMDYNPSNIHTEFVNQIEHNWGEDAEKITKELETGETWEKPPITDTLTPEQKEILKRYNDFHMNLLPENGQEEYKNLKANQEKHTDYDTIKAERDAGLNTFGNQLPSKVKTQLDSGTSIFPTENPNDVKTKYDEPKETHAPADLKPVDLPANGKDYLTRPNIPVSENDGNTDYSKRPTQVLLNQAVQQEKDKYKDYNDLKNEVGDGHTNFPNLKPNVVKGNISNLEKRPDISISKQQGDTDYSLRKPLGDYNKIDSDLKKGTSKFPALTPEAVYTKYSEQKGTLTSDQQNKLNDYNNMKNNLDAGLNVFPLPKTPQGVKNELDQLIGNKPVEDIENNYFVKAINLKLKEAWSAPKPMMPFYTRIFEAFLRGENNGTDEQQKAIKYTKVKVLAALAYTKKNTPSILNF